MTAILELGKAVQARRSQMGLTQEALAALSGLSRQTISQLESGTIGDLSLGRAEKLANVLGLSLQVAGSARPKPVRRMSALGRAAQTASVSYRTPVTPATLRKVLVSGKLAAKDAPHVSALLDEAPPSLLASVADQLAGQAGGNAAVWKNYRRLAHQLKSRRDLWK